MAWARLDDGFHDHPKVDGLSLAAVGLYTLCLTWAHRHRKTAAVQGHITDARVAKVAGKQGAKLAGELVTSGLWEIEENLGGFVIHDFADYLPKERDPDERREAGRRGAKKRWEADSKPDGNLPSTSMASDSSRASARAFPSRPVPSHTQEAPQDPAPAKPTRERDEIWDTLLDACNIDPTNIPTSARGAYNRAVKDLRDIGATPGEIRRRAAIFRGQWRDVSLTPTALARRWSECDRPTSGSPAPSRNAQILAANLTAAEAFDAQREHPDRRALG
jgi:hypothetical protein